MSAGPYRALLLHCLRFDVLEGGEQRGASRLYAGVLSAVLLMTLLAATLGDQPSTVAVPAVFAITGILAFFGILGEVGAGLVDPRDVPLLRILPASPGVYFAARLSAFGAWILLKVLAYGIIPAVVFSTGGRGPWFAFLPYLLSLWLLFAALSGFAVLLFLVLQRLFDPAWLRDFMVWLQVALFVVGTVGWMVLWNSWDAEGGGLELFAAAAWPTAWFAELHLAATGAAAEGRGIALALTATLLVGLLLWRMGRDYLGILGRVLRPVSSRSRNSAPWLRRSFERAFVPPAERAGFHLGLALIRRERTFRLQSYPLLAYPLLFLSFGRGADDGGLFAILFSHLTSLYLPIVSIFLRFSDHARAAWVWTLHRRQAPGAAWAGARKALVLAVVAPLAVVLIGLLIAEMGVAGGLSSGLIATSVAVFVALGGPVPGRPPFSDSFSGVVEAREEISRVYPLFFLAVVVGGMQFWLWRSAPAWMPLLALVAVSLAIWQLRRPPVEVTAEDPVHTAVSLHPPAPSQPFATRLRAELRGLVVLYSALGVWAVVVALFL